MRTRVRVAAAGTVLAALLSACGDAAGPTDAPGGRAERAVPASDLVRTGTVADHPDRPIQIGLSSDGGIHVDSGLVDLEGLEVFLAEHARGPGNVEDGGESARNVVLRVHPALPWEVVQWTIMSCAHPSVKAYRIHFAVQPEAGGPEGSIPMHLPRDGSRRGIVCFVEGYPQLSVRLYPQEGVLDRAVVFARIKDEIAARGSPPLWANISVPAPGRVESRHVLTLVDLLMRAGTTDIGFEGRALPPSEARLAGPGERTWVQRYVAEHPLPARGASVRIGDLLLEGREPTGAAVLPPPPARIRAKPPPTDPPQPEVQEVVEGTEEVLAQESEMRDVPVDEEHPGDSEGPVRWVVGGTGESVRGAFKGRADLKEHLAQRPAVKKLDAVGHALEWLAAHQSEDGGWEADGFHAWCDGATNTGERPDGPGKGMYDVGVTGLALCAFLGAGYTNRGDHRFARIVRKGLAYLKNAQDPEGCFGHRSNIHYVYNHASATLAMVEAYGMTESPIFKGSAQRGLDFIALARNPHFAWRYGVKPGDSDTSVTGWMMMALKSALLVNDDAQKRGKPLPLVVDEDAFEGMKAWLEKMTDPATGRVGYLQRGGRPTRPQHLVEAFPAERSEAMTAVGLLARIFLGEDPRTSTAIAKCTALCLERPPVWNRTDGSIDMAYWYYGTLALFQVGGAAWAAWERSVEPAIAAQQRLDGTYCSFKGSWDPVDPWGEDGGRVYATALLCMSMEVHHRYERVFGTR